MAFTLTPYPSRPLKPLTGLEPLTELQQAARLRVRALSGYQHTYDTFDLVANIVPVPERETGAEPEDI